MIKLSPVKRALIRAFIFLLVSFVIAFFLLSKTMPGGITFIFVMSVFFLAFSIVMVISFVHIMRGGE